MSILIQPPQPAPGFSWANQIGPIISGLISLAVIVFSYYTTKSTLKVSRENTEAANKASFKNTISTLNSKRIEEQKEEIYKKLNNFYSPFDQLRKKSSLLYEIFSNKFYERYPEKYEKNNPDKKFRTLVYLLDGGTVEKNEKTLLDEIITIGEKCEKLIHDKAGLIDNEELRLKWFPKASTHYLILRLAYQGKLEGDTENLKIHVFPSEIDPLVEARIQSLHDQLKLLDSAT